jgi:carbonic anhydrase
LQTELRDNPGQLLAAAIRANILAAANQLRHGSQLLEQLIENGELTVVGAEYSLETGEVDFFDGL